MMLRRGADVASTDGSFGLLSDVVVDPISRQITHLVVTPTGVHRQPRLVPLWLVSETKSGLRVELDTAHVRELQRVLGGDFIRSDASTIESDFEHDVRFKTVLRQPYFEAAIPDDDGKEHTAIPQADWEVRTDVLVVSCSGRRLGRAVGFLVDADAVWAVVVRSGLIGFQHDVVVPVASIAEVLDDVVMLDLDRHQFRRLAHSHFVPGPGASGGRVDRVRHAGFGLWYEIRDRASRARQGLRRRG